MKAMQDNIDRLADHLDYISENQLHGKVVTGSARAMAFKILNLPGFDAAMGLIIIINLAVMVIEIDMSVTGDEEKEDGLHWTVVFGWTVLSIFIIELLMRLIAFRCAFWKDPWDIGDFVIVVTDVAFTIVGLIAGDVFPVSILRVFRLSKLARVSKVLRVFPELRMLLVGLVHSIRAIFWGTILLALFLLVWSMIAVLVIHPLNVTIDYGPGCDRCPRAYSSVMQAVMSFFLQFVVGDQWGSTTVPIIEKYPASILFFLPAFLSIGLSVMNLMLAVVVNLAQKAYDNEAEQEAAQQALEKASKQDTVLRLCKEIDADGSGALNHDEIFKGFMEPGEFHDTMKEMGFSAEDFEEAWKIIDIDETGIVTYKELMNFLFTMKSSNVHYTLQYIKHYVTWIKNANMKQLLQQATEELTMEKKLQENMGIVEKEEEYILKEEQRIEQALTHLEKAKLEATPDTFEQVKCSTLKGETNIEENLRPHQTRNQGAPEECQTQLMSADAKALASTPMRNHHHHEGAPEECQTQAIASDAKAPPQVRRVVNVDQLPLDVFVEPEEAPPALNEAIQDLVKQVGNCVERMHIELKDILIDMKSTPNEQKHSQDILINMNSTPRTENSRDSKLLNGTDSYGIPRRENSRDSKLLNVHNSGCKHGSKNSTPRTENSRDSKLLNGPDSGGKHGSRKHKVPSRSVWAGSLVPNPTHSSI